MSIYGAAKNGLFVQEAYTTNRVSQTNLLGIEAGNATPETIGKIRARLEQLTTDIGFANQVEDVIKKAITNLQV